MLDFLRNLGRKPSAPEAPRAPVPEEIPAQDYSIRLAYAGKAGAGVRITAGTVAPPDLVKMIGEFAKGEIDVIPPRAQEYSHAVPSLSRPTEAAAWIEAHESLSPVARHAVFVLESIGALDPTVDTLVCGLLDGETDTTGCPDYAAIVGGIASHWDEATGDLVVRPIVGWGGTGVRGDSDRTGTRLLAEINKNIRSNQNALDIVVPSLPMIPSGQAGLVCAHCGFASAHRRAFYCPKCGMRLLRG